MYNDIIKISDLTFKYEKNLIFEHFDLSISRGDWVSIVGANGSGKSTLVKLLVGLLETDAYISIDNLRLDKHNLKHIRKKIGVIFENINNIFVAETVCDDMAFALENLRYKPDDIKFRIEEVASMIGILDILEVDPYSLSSAEKQKVAIASAIMTKPSILILDESLSMLNKKEKKEILKILNKLHKEEQITIIQITHDLEETYMSNRMIVLNKGKIVNDGKTFDVLMEDRVLNQAAIELPFVVELSIKLKLYGIVDKLILDMDRMVDEIWK